MPRRLILYPPRHLIRIDPQGIVRQSCRAFGVMILTGW
jgi:hypothetical protein